MPPKKVEKKEIQTIFNIEEQPTWWEYKEYDEEQINNINQFFVDYQLELRDILDNDLSQSIRNMSNKMGILVHHQFAEPIVPPTPQAEVQEGDEENKGSQIQNTQENIIQGGQGQQLQTQQTQNQPSQGGENEENQQQQAEKANYMILQNCKYDYPTFKMLLYHYENQEDLTVMKFANNCFSELNAKALFDYVCNQTENQKVQKFFFDWNPLEEQLAQELLQKLALSTIEFLVLRSNQINSQQIKALCEQMKVTESCQIKHLELYDNRIEAEGFQAIGDLIKDYMKLEYFSLAKNYISKFEDIKPITENIGYTVLDEEGVQKYKEEEKERDDLLALKAKKKKVDEVRLAQLQKLLPLKEVGEEGSGVFAHVRNPQLKIFNLAMNEFNDDDKDEIQEFINNLPEDFSLMLLHNNFEQKTKEKIRSKHRKTVVI